MTAMDPTQFLMQRHYASPRNDDDASISYSDMPRDYPPAGYMDLMLSRGSYGALPSPVTCESFAGSVGCDPPALIFAADSPFMMNGGSHVLAQNYLDESDIPLPASNLSAGSVSSSTVGSPLSNYERSAVMPEWSTSNGFGYSPRIVGHNDFHTSSSNYAFHTTTTTTSVEDLNNPVELAPVPKIPSFTDPSLLHPDITIPRAMSPYNTDMPNHIATQPPSPALPESPQTHVGCPSPYAVPGTFYQQRCAGLEAPVDQDQRRLSLASYQSTYSPEPYQGGGSDAESSQRQRCPHPDCGKTFKDLKAHMLTHQNERPEKCPIQTCEYHIKGFARKYDKNRHTLTHYKGTMVCGFCPGSGSASEKSFNRADVFKRHLTSVHGVEQTSPNYRRKGSAQKAGNKVVTRPSSEASGRCSTCSAVFANPQEFYEHLDDCVLRVVQQADPVEEINAQRLAEVENDPDVHDTLEKNGLPTSTVMTTAPEAELEDDDAMDNAPAGEEPSTTGLSSIQTRLSMCQVPSPRRTATKCSNPVNGVLKSRGLTHSRGGVPVVSRTRANKSRRPFPSSWGFDPSQMTMKKRVMAIFDGPRRLAKDDMMLCRDHEVRIQLSDGKSYVTDLDVQTLKRAQGFLDATAEEKGPWISDDPTDREFQAMLEYAAGSCKQVSFS